MSVTDKNEKKCPCCQILEFKSKKTEKDQIPPEVMREYKKLMVAFIASASALLEGYF